MSIKKTVYTTTKKIKKNKKLRRTPHLRQPAAKSPRTKANAGGGHA